MYARYLLLVISSFAAHSLTKRAPYKMYEITGSCRRWPRISRPLMSSVTEPPLHSWERERERRERGREAWREADRETERGGGARTVTPPSLTTLDYDSWGEQSHTQNQSESRLPLQKLWSISWLCNGIKMHVQYVRGLLWQTLTLSISNIFKNEVI